MKPKFPLANTWWGHSSQIDTSENSSLGISAIPNVLGLDVLIQEDKFKPKYIIVGVNGGC